MQRLDDKRLGKSIELNQKFSKVPMKRILNKVELFKRRKAEVIYFTPMIINSEII